MKEFNLKLGLKVLAVMLVAFLGVIASSGAMNYGYSTKEWLYFFAGILNFGTDAYASWNLYKYFFKKEKPQEEQSNTIR